MVNKIIMTHDLADTNFSWIVAQSTKVVPLVLHMYVQGSCYHGN